MIQKAHFPKFRTGELLQFIYDAVEICNNNDAAKLQITDKVNEVANINKELDASFKIDQASALSIELVELDQRRDACIIGIKLNAESWSYHFDPAKVKVANLVLRSIDKYGAGIAKLNYQAETSTINSIVESWSSNNELAEAMNTLQLRAWAEELKSTNDLFSKKYLSRVEAKSQTSQSASSIVLRQSAIACYRSLCQNIEARATLTTGVYDAVINQINVLTAKYNQLVDTRALSQQKKTTI